MAKTYFISFNGVDYSEFYPANRPVIPMKKEGGEMFFRYTVDQFIITRTNNVTVYDTLNSYFFDKTKFATTLNFKVKKSGVDKYLFKMSVNEAQINTENGSFICTPRTNDTYQTVMDKYEVKYADRAGAGLFGSTDIYYPTDAANSFSNVDFSVFNDTPGTVSWTNSAAGGVEQKADHPLSTNFNGQVIQITIENYTTDGLDIRLRLIDSNDGTTDVSAADAIITGDGVYTLTQDAASTGAVVVRMAQPNTAPPNVTGSFDYVIYEPIIKSSIGDDLQDFMQRLIGASFMATGLTVKSTYLWNDALETDAPPNIDTYITANPTKDYVVEGSAIWNDLFFGRTDKWTTTSNESVEISLKDVMDILKNKLRAWWFIDSDGDLRIEHEKYFRDYAPQIDITSGTYDAYMPEVDTLNYLYNKGEIYGSINYSEQNADNEDFVAYPIVYDPDLTSTRALDISVDVTTDIDYVVSNPSEASNQGVTLLRMIPLNTTYVVAIDQSTLDTDKYYPNAKLGWAYLFVNYFSYFGEGASADVNDGTTLTLDGVKEFLEQKDISLYYSGELDWKKPITTTIGTAWIQSFEETEDEFLKINIAYNPYR